MDKSKEITDEEIRDIARKIFEALRPVAAKLGGETVPKRIAGKNLSNFVEVIRYFQEIGQKQDFLASSTLPRDFKAKQQILLSDQFLRDLFGLKNEDPIEEIINYSNPKVGYDKISPNEEYSNRMQNTIHQILYSISKLGKITQFENLLQSMEEDTFYASFQSAERINKKLKYFMKERKRFSRHIVENYIEYYKEVSGFLEKLITILYGMKLILDKNYQPFPEIVKKYQVGNMVKELTKKELFSIFIDAYNPHIRNSVMHITYYMDPLNKVLEFVDKEYKITMNFSEFILYVQEIVRRAAILSKIEYELSYLQFLEYKKQREQIMRT